ncbi:hypothetical protein, partial [Streptacidiphilus albus]|uniref:hypothetical protein n=1 Tax=Streptacidiphilus albus TaxID=105425 RepID=UPI0005AAE912
MTRAASPDEGTADGRLLAGRYRLTGRARGTGVAAVDVRSGAEVQLDAVPLPVTVTPFDQDLPAGSDETAARALTQTAFVTQVVPDHPRLSQVFQVFAEDGYLWVAGEAVPGAPLAALLERGPLSAYRVAELAHDLVAALRAVHAMGLVHGNLTADTVTVCEDGTALLGGLVVGAAQEALCGGPGAGTPGAGVPESPWNPARVRARDARAVIVGPVSERWAPEQAGPGTAREAAAEVAAGTAAGRPVGPAADTWALGALLHRALTGGPLLPEQDAAHQGRVRPADRRTLPGPSKAGPAKELGPLGPLVLRLLAVDPEARPALAEVQEELRRLLLRAPEPVDQDAVSAVAELLPPPRRAALGGRRRTGAGPGGALSAEPSETRHHHAAPARHPARLGAVLVGGILVLVLLLLVAVVLAAG